MTLFCAFCGTIWERVAAIQSNNTASLHLDEPVMKRHYVYLNDSRTPRNAGTRRDVQYVQNKLCTFLAIYVENTSGQ